MHALILVAVIFAAVIALFLGVRKVLHWGRMAYRKDAGSQTSSGKDEDRMYSLLLSD
jgi:hypothetical protein